MSISNVLKHVWRGYLKKFFFNIFISKLINYLLGIGIENVLFVKQCQLLVKLSLDQQAFPKINCGHIVSNEAVNI